MSTADREREQYEALVAAYRQLPRPEPPPERDRAVLAAARSAVSGKHTTQSRWPALLGTAATLALAVGLTWQMRQQDVRAPAPGGDGAAMPSVVAPATTGGAAPSSPKAIAEPASTPGPERQDRALEAHRKQATKLDEAAPLRKQERDSEVESVAIEPPPPAPPPPPVIAPEMRDAPASSAPVLEERKAMPPEPPREADAAGMPASQAEPAQPFPQDARAPAPTSPPAAPSATPEPRPAAPAGSGPGITGAAPAKAAAGSLRRERSEDLAKPRDAAAWLDEIRRLLRQGQRERAIDEVEDFKAAFPETPLPEDLRDLSP